MKIKISDCDLSIPERDPCENPMKTVCLTLVSREYDDAWLKSQTWDDISVYKYTNIDFAIIEGICTSRRYMYYLIFFVILFN